ncbi:MAG: hypothetical protein ACI8WB_000511 [Phenylobacterium sp.]
MLWLVALAILFLIFMTIVEVSGAFADSDTTVTVKSVEFKEMICAWWSAAVRG